ncbi:MAG: flagellar hook capping FlgD N-terminal domain-containing protein [Rariglobus sp.]
MQVNPVSNLGAAASADTSNRVPQKQLGQGDFLKLLTVQLQQQDPMKPMDDTQSIAQMAQFSSLQQMTALQQGMESMRLDSQLSSAGSLLGRQVTLTDAKGVEVTGIVSSVEQTASGPKLSIDGKSYAYSTLTRVSPAPAEQPTA